MAGSRFFIACEGLAIGESALERRGLPRGILRGRFEPADGYETVRAIFRADALARARPDDPDGETLLRAHYKARDQLRFEVTDSAGRAIPVEYVHVYEPLRPGEPFEVIARLAVPTRRPRARSRWRRSGPDV